MVAMAKKSQFRLDLDEETASAADQLFADRGFSRTEAITRVLRWLLAAPRIVQQDAFGQIPDELRDAASAKLIELVGMDEAQRRRLNEPGGGSDLRAAANQAALKGAIGGRRKPREQPRDQAG